MFFVALSIFVWLETASGVCDLWVLSSDWWSILHLSRKFTWVWCSYMNVSSRPYHYERRETVPCFTGQSEIQNIPLQSRHRLIWRFHMRRPLMAASPFLFFIKFVVVIWAFHPSLSCCERDGDVSLSSHNIPSQSIRLLIALFHTRRSLMAYFSGSLDCLVYF